MVRRSNNDDQPLVKSNVMAVVGLSANAVFVAYLVFQAWTGPEKMRVWALVGAVGLALLTCTVAWERFGKRRWRRRN